jgi:hypothetical protein
MNIALSVELDRAEEEANDSEPDRIKNNEFLRLTDLIESAISARSTGN